MYANLRWTFPALSDYYSLQYNFWMVSSHDKKTMSNDQTDSSSTTDVVVQQINNQQQQQQQQQQSNGGFVSRLASPFKSSSNSNALNKVGYKRVIQLHFFLLA